MEESPNELVAEWLRLKKEYARLNELRVKIYKVAGIRDQEQEFRTLASGLIKMNNFWYPSSGDPPIHIKAVNECLKIRRERSEIDLQIKRIQIEALTRGIDLSELSLIGDPPPEKANRAASSDSISVSDIPSEVEKPSTAQETKPTLRRLPRKPQKPTAAEKAIIKAIKDGLEGEAFCRRLDFEEVPPRNGWLSLRPPKPTWPGKYEQAYSHGPTAQTLFWQRRIQNYKCYTGRKFRHLIRSDNSLPTRQGK